MKIVEGKGVCNGVAIGKILVYQNGPVEIGKKKIEDFEAEVEKYRRAKQTAIEQLDDLYKKACIEAGEENAAIFEVHQMMLEDEDYNEAIENMIQTEEVNAEYAVSVTGDHFAEMFANMEDEYFRARSADIKDISERIINILVHKCDAACLEEPVILVANDLAPSETIQLDKEKLLAFVTRYGSTNSHTAILARTMGIPALIGIDYLEDCDGKLGIIDGNKGVFIIDPDEATLSEYKRQLEEGKKQKDLLEALKGKETITKSGKKIRLYGNIGNVSDLGAIIANDAAGIGLFRSEFIYLESEDYPTEENQYQIYKQVAETMVDKKVIIRTLDIGADKQVDYFKLPHEENPAMGCRAIRICLTREEIFRTQLRALYRASAFGDISIMYPMITSVEEVLKIKEISKSVKEELIQEGITIGNVEEGIMIETPAAVIISDLLAKEVDFFSIGTNDLTQYTLAIDRQNEALDEFYNAHHTAIIRMIKMVVDNAHREGIWAGICGELGADTSLTETFLEMGVDELSVAPACILPIRKIIREYEG